MNPLDVRDVPRTLRRVAFLLARAQIGRLHAEQQGKVPFMSQMSSSIGDSGSGAGASLKNAGTGRAVLVLAIAVVLGITLLHELDNAPAGASNLASATTKAKAHNTTPAANAVPSTTTLPARSPAEVKVLVANGVGVNGAASKVAGRLQPIGYQLVKPGNTINKSTTSSVQYTPGYQAEAQALATSLNIPSASVQPIATPSPVTDLQGANVIVVVGDELANGGTSANGTTNTTTAGSNSNGTTNTTAAGTTSNNANSTTNNASNNASSFNAGVNGPLGKATTNTTTASH
jgi:hypothetical protein